MKYQKRPRLSKVLAELMIAQMKQKHIPQSALPQALIPVPMHPKRQRQRGYNQAIYLAKHLGKRFNIPVITEGLVKIRSTDSQRSLKAANRQSNLLQSFNLNPKKKSKLESLDHVALIDDVITTGATAEAACQCLKSAGLSEIEVWSVARTP